MQIFSCSLYSDTLILSKAGVTLVIWKFRAVVCRGALHMNWGRSRNVPGLLRNAPLLDV